MSDELTKPATEIEIADTLLLFYSYRVITSREYRDRVQKAKLVVRRMAFELDALRVKKEKK